MEQTTGWRPIEEMDLFQEVEKLCDEVWRMVMRWPPFARDTVGGQLVRAADSTGANLVEGDSRFHHREKLHFLYIARGSTAEARFWIRRARARGLVKAEDADALHQRYASVGRWINSQVTQRRRLMREFKEEPGDG